MTGRANGGMVVHVGLVVVAVAFAASSSYAESRQFRLSPGQTAELSGHTVTYLGTRTVEHPHKTTSSARVRVDGGKVYAPGLNQFPFATQAIGSPSVKVGPFEDVYLTLVSAPEAGLRDPNAVVGDDAAVIGVRVQPLIVWLWIGGGIMALGTVLAAWPRSRRRAGPAVEAPAEPSAERVAVPT